MISDYTFFSKDPGHWGKSYQSLLGCHDICLLLEWFHVTHVTQSELASLTCLKAWGDHQKFHSNVAFLLVLPKEGSLGEMVYGLAMVWVHPYQARVSTIDDVAKQLTQVASTGPNWLCALVQLSGDAHHVPLPTEGVMMEGRGIPAMSLAERSASWRFVNFWAQAPRWFTQKDLTGVKFQW